MNMPALSAEASLYKTSNGYRTSGVVFSSAEANILAQLIKGTGKRPGNRELDRICGQMADIINEAFTEGIRQESQGNWAEGAAWHDHAIDLLAAGVTSTACSFSAE